jgi:TolB protein
MTSRLQATATRALIVALMAGLGACNGQPTKTAFTPTDRPLTVPPPAPVAMNQPPRMDPLAFSTGGVHANQPLAVNSTSTMPFSARGPEQARQTKAPNSAMNLYSEVIASSMAGKNGGPSRAGGTNLSQISFSQEGADFDPDVSRDGKHIVFASTQHRMTSDLYIKSVESRVVTQLTSDAGNAVMPRISPDGTRIAFASNRSGNWDIYVMPITGGKAMQITSSAADDLHPTWSPDGTHLAFCRLGEVSNQWEIWVTDVGNSGVAKFIGCGLFPEWCPVSGTGTDGGDCIAFQKSRERGDRAFGIWTIDYKDGQAGNTTEIVSSPIAACINPAWSPDGKWITFATVPNPAKWASSPNGRPSSADLWMTDLNGSTRVALTAGRAVNLMPSWGPGNRIFFVSDRGGTDNIWALDASSVIQLASTNMRMSNNLAAALSGGGAATTSHSAPEPAPAPVATVPTGEPVPQEPH